MNPKQNEGTLLFAFILVIGLIAITRFTSIKPHWGSLEMRPTSTITVSGVAKKDQANQIANFGAGMESIEATKEEALNKTNEAMNQLIDKVKQMGIDDKDIQTQAVNVYQETEYVNEGPEIMESPDTTPMIYPQNPGKAQKGQWRASNSISIKLREVDKAKTLLSILNESGANNVYGPNFSIDDSESATDELLSAAVVNAREKAEKIAAANKQKVGKIISVTEGGEAYPMYRAYDSVMPMALGAEKSVTNADLEPGSSQTSKSVTVTFELN